MKDSSYAESLTDDELLAILGLTAEEYEEIYRADMTADELVSIATKRREGIEAKNGFE